MNNRKRNALIAILILFSILALGSGYIKKSDAKNTEKEIVNSDVGLEEIPSDYLVDDSFISHLPIVVIDIGEEEIPLAYNYDIEKGIVVPIEDVDPYVNGEMFIYAGNEVNSLSDTPQTTSGMHIKYRGNSSLFYEKKQYKIELLDENGLEISKNLLGMGADSDWILNISMADKSLLRNYIAYTIAGEIDEYTPDVQYCEVLIKKGEKYEYEGLYLLCESIKVDDDRVDLSDYNKDGISSYLLKRDRYDEEAVNLDTWATENNLTYGSITIEYPKADNLTKETISNIEDRISTIEKILYSDNENDFEEIWDYIDKDSFVDYFLLNEYFGNYDAGNNSTYMYSNLGGKLHIGPVWDFDGGCDNYADVPAEIDKIAFETVTWFDKLTEHYSFDIALERRYKELQKTVLNEQYVNNLIDETVEYIGRAQLRDYSRWGKAYSEYVLADSNSEYGVYTERNVDSFEEEVQRLKNYITEHSGAMNYEIHNLSANHYSQSYNSNYGIWAIVFIVLFLSSIVIVRKR